MWQVMDLLYFEVFEYWCLQVVVEILICLCEVFVFEVMVGFVYLYVVVFFCELQCGDGIVEI